MIESGQATRKEIYSQPEAWSAALEVLFKQMENLKNIYQPGKYKQVIFTGCGSTYYLALAASSLFSELNHPISRALPASELWLYPHLTYSPGTHCLLVAVSRSGATTETLQACYEFKHNNLGDLLTLSCYEDAPLASLGDVNILLPSGAEESVAQTRAFSTLYLATVYLSALWAGCDDLVKSLSSLPTIARRLLQDYPPLLTRLAERPDFERFYFLGSGQRYGLAAELSLKMKEMSLSHSEPFHFMEFRHGPISMINSSAIVINLLSGATRGYEDAVKAQVQSLGGFTLTIGESNCEINFSSNLNESIRNILYLPMGQVLAFEHSLSKNLNPDKPHNLEAVVKLSQ